LRLAGQPLFLIPFSIGNVLRALFSGPLFDAMAAADDHWHLRRFGSTVDRDRLVVRARLAHGDDDDRLGINIFFFASAEASSPYLTVSELFPLEGARWRLPSSMPSARRLQSHRHRFQRFDRD
jgi:hypothetical protein